MEGEDKQRQRGETRDGKEREWERDHCDVPINWAFALHPTSAQFAGLPAPTTSPKPAPTMGEAYTDVHTPMNQM